MVGALFTDATDAGTSTIGYHLITYAGANRFKYGMRTQDEANVRVEGDSLITGPFHCRSWHAPIGKLSDDERAYDGGD